MTAPDADLLHACAEFDRLEHACLATRGGCEDADTAAWQAAEAERARLVAEQRVWLDRICAARVTTAEGVLAIVASLAVFSTCNPDIADERAGFIDDRLVGALRRVMAGKVGGTASEP